MKNIPVILFCLLFTKILFSQKHWESIVIDSNKWSYLPALSEPDPTWNQPEFNDSTWETGKGGFGYGDEDDTTITDVVNSIYLRKKITIDDTSIIEQLLLDIDYDDAFVFYLNGAELARSSNILDSPPLYNSGVTFTHEAQLYQGGMPERHVLNISALIQGENTIAVHIINTGLTSSDMSARVFLNAEINNDDTIYQPIPSWFLEPVSFEESNLPLILINTLGQSIPDEPKLTALMKVINNQDKINSIYDTIYEYNGNIGIEIRGNSSTMYEKKNYTLETRTDSGTNLNISLLGMPEENDWVLHGPYSDKSLMRNVLAYRLGNTMGNWSPRTRFCELYINEEYRGVYVLMEKIKIDKNRVNIANLLPEDISGDELTGGYILRIDRDRPGAWISPFLGRTGTSIVFISYLDPKYDELAEQQSEYIKDYVTDFEYALAGDDFKDPIIGYRAYIDVVSFIDYFLITELARDLDGYRCSVYFHKDKDSKGGKLNISPLWDFNLCFGNGNFMEADKPEGWVVEGIGSGDGYEPAFWWNRLLQDPYFVEKLKQRWNDLRADKFNTDYIFSFIDSCTNLLSAAQQRNFTKFNNLDRYVWPNAYIGGTYTAEIDYLKDWFTNRFNWLDKNIAVIKRDYMEIVERFPNNNTSMISLIKKDHLVIFPNPFTEKVTIHLNLTKDSKVDIVIHNVLGEKIIHQSEILSEGDHEFTFTGEELDQSGNLLFYTLVIDGEAIQNGKMIKY